jgi:hypothetical protein
MDFGHSNLARMVTGDFNCSILIEKGQDRALCHKNIRRVHEILIGIQK